MSTTETTLLDAALLYIALGWPVVPLHTPVDGVCDCPRRAACDSPGKHPRTRNGLKDSSTDPDVIRRWWRMWPHANIGVDLAGAGLVDIAPDSPEWWAEFTARGLPASLRFASGGGEGHEHYWYARTRDCAIHRDTRTGEYDLMSNGYAVVPPSLHASGRLYTWVNPPDRLPVATTTVAVPQWAAMQLNRRAHRIPRDDEPVFENQPPISLGGDDLERWHGRLFDARPDGGVDRSFSLWRLAVMLLRGGLTPPFVASFLAERDQALGWTKFTGRQDAAHRYATIVEYAYKGIGPKRARVGHSSRNGHVQDPPPAPGEDVWLTGASIDDVEDEDITWIARGFVGVGLVSELDGKVKQSGKTTLSLALCRCVLTSAPFLDEPTTYAPVVYLSEQSAPSFKRNLRRAGLLGRSDLHILLWSRVSGVKWADVVKTAVARAHEVGAKTLVIDTLGQFSGIRGDHENNAGSAMSVMEPLQVAANDGLAVLVLRHDRKSGGDVGDSGRGSSAYAGAVDVILHLERVNTSQPGHDRQRVIEGLSRFEETPSKLLVELSENEPYTYTAIGDVGLLREHMLRTELLRELPTTAAEAMTLPQIREVVAADRNAVLRVLGQLVHVRDVVRIGAGVRGDPYRYYRQAAEDEADE